MEPFPGIQVFGIVNNDDELDESSAAGSYIAGGGNVDDIVSLKRFTFYHNNYPVWPRLPRDGLYSYSYVGDRPEGSSGYDCARHYNTVDPLYYTPARVAQLAKAYAEQDEDETFSLTMFNVSSVLRNQVYRDFRMEMANVFHSGNNHVGIMQHPNFNLASPTKRKTYAKQCKEFFEYVIHPQKMIILETISALQALGIYHHLDCQSMIDLYEMSMYHPLAVVCQGCRKIDWFYSNNNEMDMGYIMCMTEGCPFESRRRDLIDFRMMALPLHGFNLHDFYKQIFN
jgi:hypothetical protein